MIHLREYQEQCLTDLARHRAEKPDETRLAVIMPTGTGKTITFSAEACDFLDSFQGAGNRVLVLVHTEELTAQAEAKVRLMVAGRPTMDGATYSVGVVKAERNEVNADIVIGSVQTLANPARRAQLTDVGHVIVDECHHAIAPAYQAILTHYGAFPDCPHPYGSPCEECRETGWLEPPITVTGYTATLERGDGNSLGSVWQDVAFSRSISWAVRKGFLVPPRAYRVEVPGLEIVTVRHSGDVHDLADRIFSGPQLDNALVDSIAPERIVEAWTEHAKDRSTVLFAPLVRSAREFADAFTDVGVVAEPIYGDMPERDRRAALRMYEAGEIQVLCNAMVLTEGWDSPRTECVIVARPTKSRPLFIQMAGRGLRPWLESDRPREDQDCILLVVVDATTELASIADLSDRPIAAKDGVSLLALEDEFDLSTDLAPDPEHVYDGRVHVSEFDPLVARSSKVWSRTMGGTWFVPAAKRTFVFLMQEGPGWTVASFEPQGGKRRHKGVPDLELAMALAEDVASDLGGNLAGLYADKSRAWRKAKPSLEMQDYALGLGLQDQMIAIMKSKGAGKAGRLSDLLDRTIVSRLLDPVVARVRKDVVPRP